MAILKQAAETTLGDRRSKHAPEETERKPVTDPVLENALVRPIRQEAMGVDPRGERPPDLPVLELPSSLVALMHQLPAQSKRSHVEPHRDPIAVTDAPGLLHDLNSLPRGSQTLEGARGLVPSGECFSAGSVLASHRSYAARALSVSTAMSPYSSPG